MTADDFGYDAKRDDGIVRCFTKGIVTRASLLINGSSAKTTAIQLARQNDMPLGIHVNLTEGEPLQNGNWTLRADDNSRFFRGKFGLRAALSRGEIDTTHVMYKPIFLSFINISFLLLCNNGNTYLQCKLCNPT